jgi:hypothetical protein
MTSLQNRFARCACCGDPDATKNCIKDVYSGTTVVLFRTYNCDCELEAPICPKCYSCFGTKRFNCKWCRKETFFTVDKKKPHQKFDNLSINAVIFQYRISSSIDSSRLFRSFGMISSDFSAWRNLAKFFSQLDPHFVFHIFKTFMFMNSKKVRSISQTIFQFDDKRCQHSAYMNQIVRMILYFNQMITLSKRIFCMSHMVSEEYRVIFQQHDAKLSAMIYKRILSQLANSESGFINII